MAAGAIFGGQLFHSVLAIEHKYYAGVELSFHLDIRHFFFLSPFILLFSKQAGFFYVSWADLDLPRNKNCL